MTDRIEPRATTIHVNAAAADPAFSAELAPKMPRVRPGASVIALLAALSAVAPLSVDMYLPAMPSIASDLATRASVVQWSLSVFFAGFASGQLVWGPVSDRIGRRSAVAGGLALYVVASLFCAAAASGPQLVALRFIQALGASAGPVLARAMVSDLTDREGAAQMLSVLMVAMGVAPLVAPTVGSALLVVAGWRSIFVVLAVLGALIAVASRWLPETLPPERRSRATLTEALGPVGRNYRAMLASPGFRAYTLMAMAMTSGQFAYITAAPFVFITGAGLSPRGFTMIFALNVAGLIGGAALNGRLVARHGSTRMLTLGVRLGLGAGLALLAASLTVRAGLAPWYAVLVPLLVFVTSISLVTPNAFAAALAGWPDARGTASALVGALQYGACAAIGALVASFDNTSPVAMAAAIAACTLAASAARLMARRVV